MQARDSGTVVRPAAVAGMFYPEQADELRRFLDTALSKAPRGPLPKALIVPHAGYIYSGAVAAIGYGLLRGHSATSVIVVGPAHQVYLQGSVTSAARWLTPLGAVQMHACKGLHVNEDAFAEEHSIEVQLPFLQKVMLKATITPILVGDEDPHALAAVLQKHDGLIIISSDLSHYMQYEKAQMRDEATLEHIKDLDVEQQIDACGVIGIQALLIVAKQKGWKAQLLDYRNSGDTAGDKSRVVGYAAIAFY